MINQTYIPKLLALGDPFPPRENVSAVFLIAFFDGKVLSARNERGWDIPGGHLEKGEDLLQCLCREIEEEAGVLVSGAIPFATLSSPVSPKIMLFFASRSCTISTFVPKKDAMERDLLEVDDLLSRYHGDKDLLRFLIREAERAVELIVVKY